MNQCDGYSSEHGRESSIRELKPDRREKIVLLKDHNIDMNADVTTIFDATELQGMRNGFRASAASRRVRLVVNRD